MTWQALSRHLLAQDLAHRSKATVADQAVPRTLCVQNDLRLSELHSMLPLLKVCPGVSYGWMYGWMDGWMDGYASQSTDLTDYVHVKLRPANRCYSTCNGCKPAQSRILCLRTPASVTFRLPKASACTFGNPLPTPHSCTGGPSGSRI